MQQALLQQLARPIVRDRLRALAAQLIEVDAAAFSAWLRRLILETLGEEDPFFPRQKRPKTVPGKRRRSVAASR